MKSLLFKDNLEYYNSLCIYFCMFMFC